MKAVLEKLMKKSEKKEARIRLPKDKITKLTRKLGKWPARSVTTNLESEEEVQASIHSEILITRSTHMSVLRPRANTL